MSATSSVSGFVAVCNDIANISIPETIKPRLMKGMASEGVPKVSMAAASTITLRLTPIDRRIFLFVLIFISFTFFVVHPLECKPHIYPN